ncbi:transglycosylase domain-containing protein [Thermobifida halotolerans]|uniref:Transglycosylase domain-containing protein n=1 Tax=Thermobifida halotolerans TaxID=483545 RepID=A0A399G306_9ACTN|nr:transglycosylase domain-containing protein [Thermobifida halotolerans]UOE19651.1 transglycosylase domain-containing protein [Thermobifida halotolerans]
MPGGDELSESNNGDIDPRPEVEAADAADSSATKSDVNFNEPDSGDHSDSADDHPDKTRTGAEADADTPGDGGEGDFDWFASHDDASEDESPYLEASAFKDSGSFFRDRVARSLAEEYGLELDEDGRVTDPGDSDGTAGQKTETGTGSPDEPTGAAAAREDADDTAAGEETASVDSGDGEDATGAPVADPGSGSTVEAAPSRSDDTAGVSEADEEDTERLRQSEVAAVPGTGEEDTERLGRSEAAGVSEVDEEDTERLGRSEAAAVPGTGEEDTERVRPTAPSGIDEATVQVSAVGTDQPTAATERFGSTPPEPETSSETTAVFSHGPVGTGPRQQGPASRAPRFVEGAAGPGTDTPAPVGPSPTTESAAGGTAVKAKKKQPKRKKPLWWRITRVGLVAVVLAVGAVVGGFAYAYSAFEVPDAAQADATAQGSVFYYADGSVLTERGVNRKPVSLDDVPEHVQNAILSAENRGFWDEPGVSVTGTARAVWSTVTGQQVQGGSTITQQFVRNYYEGLSQEQTIERKLKEIIIALKVDRSQPKEWILEQYLNTIYFGRNAYGIQAAAEAYYNKDVGDLTPDEAAFLAAAIQQPTKFGLADSDTTPEMESRWRYVVRGLVEMGSITEAESADYEFPKPLPERPQDNIDLSGYKGYMFQQAMKELEELGYTEDNINRGGYEIHTTFDPDLMQAAYEAVQENVPVDDLPEGVRVGLSVVDPATGGVVAFYGGQDYFENQYDSAFLGTAQAGSAMKPYVLATALKEGLSLYTVVDGSGPRMINGTRIQNAGNSPGGAMNLIQATTVSNNLGYIDLAQRVGLEKVAETAYDMGLPEDSIDLVPVLPLGANSVSPTNQAGGYATFANGGEHVETHVVSSILNKDGEEERPEPERNRVLTEEQAADATYAMRQVINSGTGTAANIGRPAAGKTGTTNGSVAAWFVGYTPQMSAAVGIYSGDNETFSVPGWGTLSGGTLPATVWRAFMQKAMADVPVEDFPSPSFSGSSPNWAPEPEPDPTESSGPSTEQPPVTEEEPPVVADPGTGVDPGTGGGGIDTGGGGGDGGGGTDPGTDPGGGGGTDPGGGGGGGDTGDGMLSPTG